MEGYSIVSEKQIQEDTYTAYRNDENPEEVIILKNKEPFEYEGDFTNYWLNLK